MIALLLLLAQSTPAVPDNDPRPDDIVVTAVRDQCKVRFADKDMTDAEFDRRAAQWKAGTPVRVVARADVDFACARKIAAKLFAKGVMKVIFVDPQGKPALPFDPPSDLPKYNVPTTAPSGGATSAWMETRAKEHSFVARAAAQLILGKCDEARTMALREGDLDAAAAVVEICRK